MQTEARNVRAGDTLWHPGVEAWVVVTDVRRVPDTKTWRAITVLAPLGQELVVYVAHDLPVEVRRP